MLEIHTKRDQAATFWKGVCMVKRPPSFVMNNAVQCFSTVLHLLSLGGDRKSISFRDSPQNMQRKQVFYNPEFQDTIHASMGEFCEV